jgi:hypothetical protein
MAACCCAGSSGGPSIRNPGPEHQSAGRSSREADPSATSGDPRVRTGMNRNDHPHDPLVVPTRFGPASAPYLAPRSGIKTTDPRSRLPSWDLRSPPITILSRSANPGPTSAAGDWQQRCWWRLFSSSPSRSGGRPLGVAVPVVSSARPSGRRWQSPSTSPLQTSSSRS